MAQHSVKKQFGMAIKTWRGRLGFSQEELAWGAGLHRTYVADIERGARNPSLQSIQKLAAALRLPFPTLPEPLGDTAHLPRTPHSDQQPHILSAEDEAHDIMLTMEAFRRANVRNSIHIARDGSEALEYLFGNE